MFFGYKSQ